MPVRISGTVQFSDDISTPSIDGATVYVYSSATMKKVGEAIVFNGNQFITADLVGPGNVLIEPGENVYAIVVAEVPPPTEHIYQIEPFIGGGGTLHTINITTTGSVTIDWGDNTSDIITTSSNVQHNYTALAGQTFDVKISGNYTLIRKSNTKSRLQVTSVLNWGVNPFITGVTAFVFGGHENMVSVPNTGLTVVGSMFRFFEECDSLVAIDAREWDLSLVTNCGSMLIRCPGLITADFSGLDLSSATSMNGMIQACNAVVSIDFNGVDASSVTDMGFAFADCGLLVTMDFSNVNTSLANNMDGMFANDTLLQVADFTNVDTSLVTHMRTMFRKCIALITTPAVDFNIASLILADDMHLDVAIPTASYDQLLNNWDGQAHQNSVIASFGVSKFSPVGATARGNLVSDGWNISDGGPA